MRKIKFRAWNDKSKEMFDVDVLAINPVMWDSGGTGVSLAYQPHIKIMQYTGLRDSKRTKEYPNGQEIYEGDIIECLHEGNGFVTKRYGAYGIETRFGFYPFVELYGFYPVIDLYGEPKVIGNIYENPELLEGEE